MSLVIHDLQGREVIKLVDSEIEAGIHCAIFDLVNLVSGLYVVRLNNADRAVIEKIVIVR